MKSTGILHRSMATLGLAFLLLSTGIAPADVEVVGIAGTAIQFDTRDKHPLMFFLKIEVDKNLSPGIRFYPCIRIVFADGTWIHGRTGCFPIGMKAGTQSGGDTYSTVPAGPADRAVRIELFATFGEPNKFFLPDEFGREIRPLDDKTLAVLKREGGFVISLPVVPAKQP